MNSLSFPQCSRLRTDTVQSKIQGPVNKLCRGRHKGLDVGTKNSDFPVNGEVFQDFPHFLPVDSAKSHIGREIFVLESGGGQALK